MLASLAVAACAYSQTTIQLGSVIGPAGTNAATVAGPGNPVNATGFATAGLTTLTSSGSSGSSSFNFASGFSDGHARAIGSNPGIGAANIYVDRKFDSANTSPLIVDTNNDGNYADESAQTGFGMHADGFITFDLAAIRSAKGLPADTPFLLTGAAGVANYNPNNTSGAIILDSAELIHFDWNSGSSPYHEYDTFSLSIPGSTNYLTFAGLAGLDQSNWGDHVGFVAVQLAAVPEPSTIVLGALGIGLLAVMTAWRRRSGA